jgi:hypothetical protein
MAKKFNFIGLWFLQIANYFFSLMLGYKDVLTLAPWMSQTRDRSNHFHCFAAQGTKASGTHE